MLWQLNISIANAIYIFFFAEFVFVFVICLYLLYLNHVALIGQRITDKSWVPIIAWKDRDISKILEHPRKERRFWKHSFFFLNMFYCLCLFKKVKLNL